MVGLQSRPDWPFWLAWKQANHHKHWVHPCLGLGWQKNQKGSSSTTMSSPIQANLQVRTHTKHGLLTLFPRMIIIAHRFRCNKVIDLARTYKWDERLSCIFQVSRVRLQNGPNRKKCYSQQIANFSANGQVIMLVMIVLLLAFLLPLPLCAFFARAFKTGHTFRTRGRVVGPMEVQRGQFSGSLHFDRNLHGCPAMAGLSKPCEDDPSPAGG